MTGDPGARIEGYSCRPLRTAPEERLGSSPRAGCRGSSRRRGSCRSGLRSERKIFWPEIWEPSWDHLLAPTVRKVTEARFLLALAKQWQRQAAQAPSI